MRGLTRRQRETLGIAAESVLKDGRFPLRPVIAAKMGISPPTVGDHLLALTRKGYLEKDAESIGGYKLTDKAFEELGSFELVNLKTEAQCCESPSYSYEPKDAVRRCASCGYRFKIVVLARG